MKTITIVVDGGVVEQVWDLPKGYNYLLLDFDIEDHDPCECDDRRPCTGMHRTLCRNCGGEIEQEGE